MKESLSQEKITDRCKRICGSDREDCFIAKSKQLECISDMIINKATCILIDLEEAIQELRPYSLDNTIERAVIASNDLVNWVKFLHLAHDLRQLSTLSHEMSLEKRKETRYPLPEIYQEYIQMFAYLKEMIFPVILLNFSRSGVQFRSPQCIEENKSIECVLETAHVVKRKVYFMVRAKYVVKQNGDYIVGGLAEEVSDSTAFDFFNNVYEFIMEIESTAKLGSKTE